MMGAKFGHPFSRARVALRHVVAQGGRYTYFSERSSVSQAALCDSDATENSRRLHAGRYRIRRGGLARAGLTRPLEAIFRTAGLWLKVVVQAGRR